MSEATKIHWLDSGEPFSEQFQDFYFSTDGGLQETEYVFLKQNGFPERFAQFQSQTLKIGETGFGTGLNFLVTCYHYLKTHAHCQAILHYTCVEKYPLSKHQLITAYQTFADKWPQLVPCCRELLAHYPDDFAAINKPILLSLFNNRIQLYFIKADAKLGLQALCKHQPPQQRQAIDAWYLDGFSPAKNPDMWHQDLFNSLASLSKTGTTISTFTSAGHVRRGLIEAGFTMSKVSGLGKKREILRGII